MAEIGHGFQKIFPKHVTITFHANGCFSFDGKLERSNVGKHISVNSLEKWSERPFWCGANLVNFRVTFLDKYWHFLLTWQLSFHVV